ncbi:SET domain-containing protein SmydA-8-like [Chelonus insularis]|uniref:SET domain-containing protein SmydA-8-like n=1 Tax=Chelonus insularis TaxID=460826 RepID=UPI00158ADF46|nr:SET domain-containing protein SmydA-8-like [Chelonus insularis]
MLKRELTEKLLQQHLNEQGLLTNDQAWTVGYSKLGGRGLFATRDIQKGEIIFIDKALITGPRCYKKYLPMCINCYKSGCTLFPCDKGCGLPICSDKCENSKNHSEAECKYLQKWKPICGSMWSMDLLQAVVPIRSLTLSESQREVVNALECHEGTLHGRELELLEKNISQPIDEEDKNFMLRVCRAFDTNAFETVRVIDNEISISLRALYPLGALQNHDCVPNTRHYFNADGLMITRAVVPIDEGEELTMTYTDLLWSTHLRRKYLIMSKHFECNCYRCSDPTEFGSNISALRCANLECYGIILPENPLNQKSSWICRQCNNKVSSRQVESIWSGIMSIVNGMVTESPRKMLKFIEGELKTLVPDTNYFMLDMKFRIISFFGRIEGLEWKNLSDKELEFKEKYCTDLIQTLDTLGCGDCQKKGLILNELFCTKRELFSRTALDNNDDENLQVNDMAQNLLEIAQKATEILQDDIAAPNDLKTLNILSLPRTNA